MISNQETRLPAARHGIGRAPMPAQSGLFAPAQTSRFAPPSSGTEDEREWDDDNVTRIEWTREEIVMLHGILFDTCVEKLNDSETPLDEVVDCLRWIFSEPGKEANAFSFSNTLKLYQRPGAWRVREAIEVGLANYLNGQFTRYPAWVAQAFWSDPDRFADELERNPQCVNEALRRRSRDGDLFAA